MNKVHALDHSTTVKRLWLNRVGVVEEQGASLTTENCTISPQLGNSIVGGRMVGGRNWLEEGVDVEGFHW